MKKFDCLVNSREWLERLASPLFIGEAILVGTFLKINGLTLHLLSTSFAQTGKLTREFHLFKTLFSWMELPQSRMNGLGLG